MASTSSNLMESTAWQITNVEEQTLLHCRCPFQLPNWLLPSSTRRAKLYARACISTGLIKEYYRFKGGALP
eukprot:373066-Pleurochrysis_carterae.AAC.1